MSLLRRASACWLLPLLLLLLGTPSVNAQSFQFNTIHSFSPSGSGGAFPGGVIQGSDDALYGVAGGGGCYGYGRVFRLALDGSFTTLHNFNLSDGAGPSGGLIQGSERSEHSFTLA